MTYCYFRWWNSIIKPLFLWDNAWEDTVQGLAWPSRCQITTRKAAVNKSTGCAAVAYHCTQHCEISKRSVYYSLDCAKVQYMAFSCAVKITITSAINKASEGIVEKKKTCPVCDELHSIFLQRRVRAYIVLCCSMLSFSAHFIMDEHISFVYRKALIMRVLVL